MLFIFTFLLATQLTAQVTIGSKTTPNKGALLDLKELDDDESKQGGKTANKGMMLPRVKLLLGDKLQPMYSYSGDNIPSADDLINHTGLTVYNTNKCDPFGTGVYIWNGSKWIGINQNSPSLAPSLMIRVDTLHIPSGMDARSSSIAQTLTFQWGGISPTFTAPQAELSGSISSGLTFTAPRGWTPASGNWTSSPAELSIWADDMTNNMISANPWTTRQSKITFNIPANDCGPALPNKALFLNQTNYAIIAGSANNPVKQIFLRDTNQANLEIQSNVPWQATVTTGTGWNIGDMFQGYTTAVTDKISNDGTTGQNYNFTYKGANVSSGKRFGNAVLTFKDPTAQAKEYTIDVMQCQGTPIMSNAYPETSTDNTTNGNSAWSGKVVRHPEKTGVYKEFYSAEFGNAGRWMITNLAAEAYDGFSHTAHRPLTPDANTSNSYDTAFWAYPNKGGNLSSSSDYTANPFLGYLYTWDAATGGKGGDDGQKNEDKYSSWAVDQSEIGMQEATGSATSSRQLRRQGICPKGWHLPSDYEWTQLEQEIIKNTSLYADANNINTSDPTDGNSVIQYSTITGPDGKINTAGEVEAPTYADAWRGSTHGQAMKDACEPNFTGKSNSPNSKGFSALLSGYGDGGNANDFGINGIFWTSSVAHARGAYARIFRATENGVYFYKPYRYYQFSVRCKKD